MQLGQPALPTVCERFCLEGVALAFFLRHTVLNFEFSTGNHPQNALPLLEILVENKGFQEIWFKDVAMNTTLEIKGYNSFLKT